MGHDVGMHDLIVQLQDGTQIHLKRDAEDALVTTSFVPGPRTSRTATDVPAGRLVIGFGPWPSWDANTTSRTATLPDEESGLFEPERLFVLREQYLFVEPLDTLARPLSLGPIHKAWWAGSEHIVQARQASGKH